MFCLLNPTILRVHPNISLGQIRPQMFDSYCKSQCCLNLSLLSPLYSDKLQHIFHCTIINLLLKSQFRSVKLPFFLLKPSGYVKIAIENDPVEIVDFPMKHGGSFHSYVNVYQAG